MTADPATRSGKMGLCGFFFDFWPFQVAIQILHRKNIEKSVKIDGFGFPNPSQNEATIVFFLQTAILEKSCSRLGEIAIFQVLGAPKPGPNPKKIDCENVLFFNIDFFGFWPRFRRVLGLQDGAKLALKPLKNFRACPFLPS